MLVRRLSEIKGVHVTNETGCRQNSNKKDASYSEEEPVNTQSAIQSSMHKPWQRRKS